MFHNTSTLQTPLQIDVSPRAPAGARGRPREEDTLDDR